MKIKILMVTVLVLCLLAAAALAETLYVQRDSVDIRKGKGSIYPVVHKAQKGEALQVISQEGNWIQVQTPKGPGWVLNTAVDAAQPTTGLGDLVGTADTSELDKSAGFKGFDEATEVKYVSRNKLQAQMKMVDRLEKLPFSIKQFENFQKQGKVGQAGGAK